MIAVANETELVEAVRAAKSPFEIVGGGTRRNFGRPASATVLDVGALKGIVKYEPEELVLTAAPGTSLMEIGQALSTKGQRLGFDPADWSSVFGATGTATLGGAISAGANGSARMRYGAARDHLLGFRAVNGFGEAFKAGGQVVKNVTGFDIPKLVCGAMGTLCVLTELTLRVFPKPSLSTTFALRDLGPDEGFALLRKIWSSPLDATGLAYVQETALIRLEGERAPLAEKCAMLRAISGGRAFVPVDEDGTRFDGIGDGSAFASLALDVWRMALPPARAAEVATEIDAPRWYGDWAGALLWLGTTPGDPNAADRMRAAAVRSGGHATLLRADTSTRARVPPFTPEEPAHAALTRSVKAAFDPLGLFNPGRMFEGI